MTLTLNIRTLFAPRKQRPAPVQAEHVVNAGDFVLTVRGFGTVTAIDTPYLDGVKYAYVEGGYKGATWSAWLTETEIF